MYKKSTEISRIEINFIPPVGSRNFKQKPYKGF